MSQNYLSLFCVKAIIFNIYWLIILYITLILLRYCIRWKDKRRKTLAYKKQLLIRYRIFNIFLMQHDIQIPSLTNIFLHIKPKSIYKNLIITKFWMENILFKLLLCEFEIETEYATYAPAPLRLWLVTLSVYNTYT